MQATDRGPASQEPGQPGCALNEFQAHRQLPRTTASKGINYPGINLTKEAKSLERKDERLPEKLKDNERQGTNESLRRQAGASDTGPNSESPQIAWAPTLTDSLPPCTSQATY